MYNVLTLPIALAVVDSLGPTVGVWPSALGSGTYQIAFVFLCMGLGFGIYGSFVVSCSLPSCHCPGEVCCRRLPLGPRTLLTEGAVRHYHDDMRLP